MQEADWIKETTSILAASPLAGLTFKRLRIPSETADIGGGDGISIIADHPDGRQVAAFTRYSESPRFTVVIIDAEAPQTLSEHLHEVAKRIASATETELSIRTTALIH